jgi:hypothetical protein
MALYEWKDGQLGPVSLQGGAQPLQAPRAQAARGGPPHHTAAADAFGAAPRLQMHALVP